jgi:phage-related protein
MNSHNQARMAADFMWSVLDHAYRPRWLRRDAYVILDIGDELEQQRDKPWLVEGRGKTPPFGEKARIEAGFLLRRLQRGGILSLPHSRPMPAVGEQCHELRIIDREQSWRIVYHIAQDAIVVLDVFRKKTRATPVQTLEVCKRRLTAYWRAIAQES